MVDSLVTHAVPCLDDTVTSVKLDRLIVGFLRGSSFLVFPFQLKKNLHMSCPIPAVTLAAPIILNIFLSRYVNVIEFL